jgi:predicted transcriptional regulator
MMTRFRTLAADDSLDRAVRELLAGSQQDFPVVIDDRPVGILRRNDLVKALSENRGDVIVADAMSPECEVVHESQSLREVVEGMHARQCSSVPVVRDARIVGLLTLENVSEMILINTALEKTGHRERLPDVGLPAQ